MRISWKFLSVNEGVKRVQHGSDFVSYLSVLSKVFSENLYSLNVTGTSALCALKKAGLKKDGVRSIKVKVNQPHYRLGGTQRVPGS